MKPSHSNSYPSSSSFTNTLTPSISNSSLNSERPCMSESSLSFQSMSPMQSPTPTNIDPILLSSPHTLQNDSQVIQSTYTSSSSLESVIQQPSVSSVYPGQWASNLPTPVIPLWSTPTMNTSMTSFPPEPVVVHKTSSHFTPIAPPANTAGYYSPRYYSKTYQSREPTSGLILASELNSAPPFQGGTNYIPMNVKHTVDCSLPEALPTDFPPNSSQVGVTDSNPKFSIPRKPPKIPLDAPTIPSLHNEAEVAGSVGSQDVGHKVNELGVNTAPYKENADVPLEEPIRRSSTREEILRRKARQDLIWGTG